MTLKELMAKLAAAKTAGQAKLKSYNALVAKGEDKLTDDEKTQLIALETELEAAEAEVETLQAEVDRQEKAKKRGTLFATTAAIVPARAAARTVREPGPDTFGFHSMAEFGVAVRNAAFGNVDPRLVQAAAEMEANAPSTFNQNQGTGNEGYLAPPEWSRTVWDMALDATDLLAMSNPEPTSANAVGKPKDETTPWGSAGVQAYWAAEAGQLQPSKFQVNADLMVLHKLYAFVGVTDELLSDAPLAQSRLTIQSGKAIAWKASDSIMWGTGSGQPTGFMKAPSLITVAEEGGQAAATIVVANLGKMLAHVLRIGGKPIWIANQDIIPQLIGLTIGNMPVYVPFNQGIQDSPWDGFLLGYPITFTEHAQTLGTAGDLVCANMAGYYSATKQGGVDFASSMHLYFDQGLTAFRWTFRLTGTPILSKAVQPARGATAKSHFIALATRA